MSANWITLSRLLLLPLAAVTLYVESLSVRLLGLGILLVGLALDSVDGIVARRRGETSLVGGVLDIAADRTYELAMWVCFAHRGLIPVAIPLIVVGRTVMTDAFRGLGVRRGVAPLAQETKGIARFLVGSTWMRSGYSAAKMAAFTVLALANAFPTQRSAGLGWVGGALAWAAVGLCVLRGLPTLAHGIRASLTRPRPATRARG